MSYSSKSSVVFIDESVSDYQTLVAGVLFDTEVVLISSQQDGIKTITDYLQKSTTIYISYLTEIQAVCI